MLALRAQGLIGQAARRDLANQIRRIILDAHQPFGAGRPAAIISHRVVLDVELELSGLALRLLAEDPVDVRAVASVRALLCDGSGPLYASGRTGPTNFAPRSKERPRRSSSTTADLLSAAIRRTPPHALSAWLCEVPAGAFAALGSSRSPLT